MMWVKWKLIWLHLEKVLILAKDRCTVCAKCTTCKEISWAHLMELLGDVGTFADGVNLNTR
jgi:hypothetical protein